MIHLLRAIPIIPLHQHDLLGDLTSLRYRAETDDGTGARIGLLVTMRDTHTSTNRDVESSKLAIRVGDINVTKGLILRRGPLWTTCNCQEVG